MSEWIKCDRCNEITQADSSGDKRYKIGVDGFDGYSAFHLCEECLKSFYLDFLGWKWNDNESQYVPQESDHKCHTCKHYTSGEHDGSCGSYICKEYSNWESEVEE